MMTDVEKREAASKMANLQHGGGGTDGCVKNLKESQDPLSTEPVSVEDAAKACGTSRASVVRHRRVKNECEPEVIEAYENQEIDLATAADAFANMEPDEQVKAVEDIKSGRKDKKQVREEAPRKKRARKKVAKGTGVKDYGYKPAAFGKQTKFQRLLNRAVCLGEVEEGVLWAKLGLPVDDRQWFYDICNELVYVRWVRQGGRVHIETTSDRTDKDLETMIRDRIKEFSDLVNSKAGCHDYNLQDAKEFCRDALKLYAAMPTN